VTLGHIADIRKLMKGTKYSTKDGKNHGNDSTFAIISKSISIAYK
jgi:hypothetical protein